MYAPQNATTRNAARILFFIRELRSVASSGQIRNPDTIPTIVRATASPAAPSAARSAYVASGESSLPVKRRYSGARPRRRRRRTAR
jgi:hypothetical protein